MKDLIVLSPSYKTFGEVIGSFTASDTSCAEFVQDDRFFWLRY